MTQHAEAFALMWYACGRCGHRERIWNSRDGVTPFGANCPSCGGPSLSHVEWPRDLTAPDYRPNRFQRYWRDGTADEASAIIEARIAMYRAKGQPIPDMIVDQLRREAQEQTGEWQKGWPFLEVCLDRPAKGRA